MNLDFVLTSLAAVAVVLGVMIIVHEFGHYAAAKLFGVRVEVFSIGFGKRLFGFRRGETDYRVSVLPFGGYVKMTGENPMDTRTGDPAEFMSHPRWQRFIIAAAGPAMNIVLAIALLTGVYAVHGYEQLAYFDEPAVIGWVPQGTAAAEAGLKQGDRIIRIDGIQNPHWQDVEYKVLLSPEQPLNLAVQRGDEILTTTLVPRMVGSSQAGEAGWIADPLQVSQVEEGLPAKLAGMQAGDSIVEVDGKPVPALHVLVEYLQEKKDQTVTLTLLREGEVLHINVAGVATQVDGVERYRVGFMAPPRVQLERLGPVAALRQSLETNKRFSYLIVEVVQKMVQGKLSLRQVEGPIGIARVSGQAAQADGWMPLLSLMALISLNLGIFNLFPIPILDGGVILLLTIESIMRRDISLKIKERIYQASFVFLILFAAMVIYNDIAKLIVS